MAAITNANPDTFQISHCIDGVKEAYVSEQNNTLYGCLVCTAEKTKEVSEQVFSTPASDVKKSDWAAYLLKEKELDGVSFEMPKTEGSSCEAMMKSVVKHGKDEHDCKMKAEVIEIAFPQQLVG